MVGEPRGEYVQMVDERRLPANERRAMAVGGCETQPAAQRLVFG